MPPTFPSTAMMFATLAYSPITLPEMSMSPEPGSPDNKPVSCEPFPMKNGATTLPSELICPLTAMLPPAIRMLPTFPAVPISVATFAKSPMRFPRNNALTAPLSISALFACSDCNA